MYLKVRKDDIIKFLGYSGSIEKHLSKNPDILTVYVKQMELFKLKDVDAKIYYDNILNVTKKSTIEYFSNKKNKKEYYFLPKHIGRIDFTKDVSNYNDFTKNNFDLMIHNALQDIISHIKKTDISLAENDCIRILSCSMNDFINKLDKKVQEKYFEKRLYKIGVISGYISMQFGFLLSKELNKFRLQKIEITNSDINHAVKYRVEVYLKKENANQK